METGWILLPDTSPTLETFRKRPRRVPMVFPSPTSTRDGYGHINGSGENYVFFQIYNDSGENYGKCKPVSVAREKNYLLVVTSPSEIVLLVVSALRFSSYTSASF
ncbi:hypothetical protein Hanom_Chr06g00526471 [Helianthus anomalus]